MRASIQIYCDNLNADFNLISSERKVLLDQITQYIKVKQRENNPINLVYICTHNSRRSHFGQIWAKVASHYYQIKNTHSFSGGTEATAFNINAINALKKVGFEISSSLLEENPKYIVSFDENEEPIVCFSKIFNDPINPQNSFAAIMTCAEAEENCPFIPGADLRIGTTYEDPKVFDDKPLKEEKYAERCKQIALETFYVFSKVK